MESTSLRTLDPICIHLDDFIDDVWREAPFPLRLSDLIWVSALLLDEVEDVEGHGCDTIDFRIGKLECLRSELRVVHKSKYNII